MIRANPLRSIVAVAVAAFYSLWNLVAWFLSEPVEMGDTYRYFGFLIFDP